MNNERDTYPKSVAYIGEYRDSRIVVHGGIAYMAAGNGTQRPQAVNRGVNRDRKGFEWIRNSYKTINREAMKVLKSLIKGLEYLITSNRKEYLGAIKHVRESAASLHETVQYFNEDITDPRALSNKKRRAGDK